MIIYFVPFERVSEFLLESNINDYLNDFDFKYSAKDNSTEWETYELESDGVSLYVENDLIVSIACDQECLFKGRNIIGMNIEEFINFSELTPENEVDSLWVSEDEKQDVYEFEDIGLQIWCSNDKIVTAIASNDIEDE